MPLVKQSISIQGCRQKFTKQVLTFNLYKVVYKPASEWSYPLGIIKDDCLFKLYSYEINMAIE